MSHPPLRTDMACRNCGALAPSNFCGACGQETALHPPTLAEFLHEFVGHYVALEGALWRTLGLLLRHPGRLTREYLAGRRRRYVLPLRLYLTASFVFFLALKLLPSERVVLQLRSAAVDSAASGASAPGIGAAAAAGIRLPGVTISASDASADGAPGSTAADKRPVDCGAEGEPACNALERLANRVGRRFRDDPRSFIAHMQSQWIAAAPYAVFLLLPAFAGIVMLAYRSRRMTYGEHVVFALHLHAFWFLALLAIAPLPEAASNVLVWILPAYGAWAMHEVYGGSWIATILRASLVGIGYGVLLTLATVAVVLAILALG